MIVETTEVAVEASSNLLKEGILGALVLIAIIAIAWLIRLFLSKVKEKDEFHREERKSLNEAIERQFVQILESNDKHNESLRVVGNTMSKIETLIESRIR